MISTSKFVVRYAETDKMGIVHHSIYPIWYEAARTELIKKIGITYSEMEEIGIMTPLAELECKYKMPATYEDEITVSVKVAKLTPARIVFEYETSKKGEEACINTGSTTHAWVGKDLRPINMKKNFPELYNKIESMIE